MAQLIRMPLYLLNKAPKMNFSVDNCIANAPRKLYTIVWRFMLMEKELKTYSMSIRVSKEELEKLKKAAKIEAYASYSEFVRRTALLEASRIVDDAKKKIYQRSKPDA